MQYENNLSRWLVFKLLKLCLLFSLKFQFLRLPEYSEFCRWQFVMDRFLHFDLLSRNLTSLPSPLLPPSSYRLGCGSSWKVSLSLGPDHPVRDPLRTTRRHNIISIDRETNYAKRVWPVIRPVGLSSSDRRTVRLGGISSRHVRCYDDDDDYYYMVRVLCYFIRRTCGHTAKDVMDVKVKGTHLVRLVKFIV